MLLEQQIWDVILLAMGAIGVLSILHGDDREISSFCGFPFHADVTYTCSHADMGLV